MKILYIVLHTQMQQERYNNIMSTWGRGQEVIFYSDHEDIRQNIIKVSDRTDYASGQEKQINIINNFPENRLDYDWFVFVDNDTFLNVKKLEKEISTFDKNIVYGQVHNCWPHDRSLWYCLGGAGIFVHKDNLIKMIGNLNQNPDTPYSDVSLGMNMRSLNIQMVNCDMMHSQNPSHYNIPDSDIKNNITFHYIKTLDEMKRLQTLC